MKRLFDQTGEIGGSDPIDAEVDAPPPAIVATIGNLIRTRAALGLRPTIAPALLFVPLGVALGPLGTNVLSGHVLARLDPVVTLALAALGVFVGLALHLRTRTEWRLFAAGAVESTTTVAVVAGASWVLLSAWGLPLGAPPIVIGTALGICAAASAAGAADPGSDPRWRIATRVADLDDVLPIVVGAMLLASLAGQPWPHVARLVLLTCGIGLAIGVVGWLLFERAHGDAERLVFIVGAVMVIGGASAYVDVSPLLAGLVAGLFWRHSPGRADEIIRRDFQKLQHPLVVLLLIAAGASLAISAAAVWIFVPYVAFRFTGKLAGGWLAARVAPDLLPADLGSLLLPPGLLGLAFALNFHQVAGAPAGAAVLSAVAAGTLVAEVLAFIIVPHGSAG